MWKFALRNLLSRPMRSLLSLLGLTVAIAGMVGLFSVARGLDRMIAETFGDIPGLVAMQPGAPIPLFSRLPAAWGRDIAAVPGVAIVNPELWQRVNVIDGKTIISPPRFLLGIDLPTRCALRYDIYRDNVIHEGRYAGRFLNESDRGTRNIVVSRQIAEEFGKTVGDTLRVNGHEMSIVGVYHHGSLLVDVTILIDIGTLREFSQFNPESVSSFYIEAEEGLDADVLAERIRQAFRGRRTEPWRPPVGWEGSQENPVAGFFRSLDRRLKSFSSDTDGDRSPPADVEQADRRPTGSTAHMHEGNGLPGKGRPAADASVPAAVGTNGQAADDLPIELRTASEWGERFDEFASDLDIILTVLTAIGVTVAVLSIVNTMLMSVTERIIEFGILKANGWSKGDVMRLITFESAVLGLGGGILGSAAGRIATEVINHTWPTRAHLYASPGLLAFSVLFATALGVLGGMYPAVWAMRMMPMDAIRRG